LRECIQCGGKGVQVGVHADLLFDVGFQRRSWAPFTYLSAQHAAQALGIDHLAALGFADDLGGYLRDAYERRRLPVLVLARELGVGNARIQRELDAAGVVRRRPGGAGPARARWAAPAQAAAASAAVEAP
jgi:hypothetical protein